MAKYLFLISSLMLVSLFIHSEYSDARFEAFKAAVAAGKESPYKQEKQSDQSLDVSKLSKDFTDAEREKYRSRMAHMAGSKNFIVIAPMTLLETLTGLARIIAYIIFFISGLAWIITVLRQRRAEKKRSQRTDHE